MESAAITPHSTRELRTADNIQLSVRHFQSRRPGIGRTLLIVHGVCEHGGRYRHVAAAATESGWETIIADLRGHGLSTGHRAHVSRFGDYLNDIEHIRREYQLLPQRTALLGHSMGGLIAIRYAQQYPQRLAALALSGPFLRAGKPPHRVTAAVGKVLSLLAPRTRFSTRIEAEDVCRDELVLQRRADDPLMQTSVTARWYDAAQSGIRRAWKNAPQMDLPLLVLQGGGDRIVDPTATERWTESVGGADKTFRLFPEHLHELLNEPDRDETIGGLLTWLDARIPA